MSDEAFDECVEFCKKTEFRHDNNGSMSTCRFGGAEGTDERVLALNTNVCRVQEETREVTPWEKVMTLNASLRRSGEARDGGLRDDVSCGEARERLMSRRLMSSTLWRCSRFCTLAE